MSNYFPSRCDSESETEETVSFPLDDFETRFRASWFGRPGAWIALAFLPTLSFLLWAAVGAPALISLWLYMQISVVWVLGCSVVSNILDHRGDPFRCLGMWFLLTIANLPILLSGAWIVIRFVLELLFRNIGTIRG